MTSLIYNEILNSLHSSVLKDIFYEIPNIRKMSSHLVKEIEELSDIEKANTNYVVKYMNIL